MEKKTKSSAKKKNKTLSPLDRVAVNIDHIVDDVACYLCEIRNED